MGQNYNELEKINYRNESKIGGVSPISKEKAKILFSQLDKYICKIYSIMNIIGTGFFFKFPFPDQFKLLPVLITNNHVLDIVNLKTNKIKIAMEDDAIEKEILLNNSRICYTNKDIDITIIEIKPDLDGINNFLDIDENIYNENYEKIYKNKEIYILQYPNAQKSSFSLGIINNICKNKIIHKCSTEVGSSGSPILNLSNYKVIGIHLGGNGTYNKGIFIKCIIDNFNKINKNILDNKKKSDKNKEKYILNTNYIINNNFGINNNYNKSEIKGKIIFDKCNMDNHDNLDNGKIIKNKKEKDNNDINPFIKNNNKNWNLNILPNSQLFGMQRIKKEYQELRDNPIIHIGVWSSLPNDNNLFEWIITIIGASDSSYSGGLFDLKVIFPENYPNRAPEVCFITPIYHPNVNPYSSKYCPLGHISISSINNFRPNTPMREIICDIFFVINYYANPLNCYDMNIGYEMKENRKLYEEKVRYFTKKYASPELGYEEYKSCQSWDFTYNFS